MLGCLKVVVRKKNFCNQLEYWKENGLSNCLLTVIFNETEVGKGEEESIYDLLKKVTENY